MGCISRMRLSYLIWLSALCLWCGASSQGQVENVPATHPVYSFLKRMEVRGLIVRYHDAVLPLSRQEIASFLSHLQSQTEELSDLERDLLEQYSREFQYDATGSAEEMLSLIDSAEPSFGVALGEELSNREKFLFAETDSMFAVFVNGLLTFDTRGGWAGSDVSETATYVQFGLRVRSTIDRHLGLYLQLTNAQFWGSRDLLQQDPVISQSFALGTLDAQNFDFVEGYARYENGIVSAQIGRERVLWGSSYDQHMTLSENIRVFDFLRADIRYKSFKYTFLHAWLLGKEKTFLAFTLPSDSAAVFYEPVVADKYFASHRIEFSFPGVLDIGAQEMVVYSNRSPDLAFINPITGIESAQRAREERDNVMWLFDVQTHFIRNVEFQLTLFFDDLHLGEFFDDKWYNRYAYQAGMFYANPFGIHNTSLIAEYTRIEPWVFAHNRSRENDYGSAGDVLGPRIGPNADSWFLRVDHAPTGNLSLSLRVHFIRQGENIVDSTGQLVKNVGGDILQPHRDADPLYKEFLDGDLVKTTRCEFRGTYEFINQWWFDVQYAFESTNNVNAGATSTLHTLIGRVRLEF